MANAGRQVGPYRLISLLGKGGMGEVWRARDSRLDRQVAVKLLPSAHAADPERRARILREAKAAAAVPHANIVTLYDLLSEEGEDFLVMELVEGKTLDKCLARGPYAVDAALDLLVAVTDALAAAHARGILHRDVKTANIMVDERGGAKILDFGLAKLRGAGDFPAPGGAEVAVRDDGLTAAGSLLGTPRFMSPEQIDGREMDERSEVFSVGVVAFEVLTGKSPYAASEIHGLFDEIRNVKPALGTKIPEPLRAIVETALEKRPEDRYPTMAALCDALRAVRTERSARARRGWWPVAVAALAAAAVIAVIVALRLAREPGEPAPQRPGDQYVEQALREYNLFYGSKATSSLRAALKHDPDHPRAHAYALLFGDLAADEKRSSVESGERILAAMSREPTRERLLLATAVALATRGPKAARGELGSAPRLDDPELGFWSAELAFRARDYEAADAEFRALLQRGADAFRGRIYDHFSAVLLYFDKASEALAIGKAYAEAFPGEADALGVYATTLAAAGELDEALRRAEEALKLNEGEDTLAGLAKVHAYRGEFRRARELYEKAVLLAPPHRRPLRRAALGLLYYLDEQMDAARAAVEPCLPNGVDSAIAERAPCLWVAGVISPERIPEILVELERLEAAGTDITPPYGFPDHLANLLRARQLFFGGGCLAAVAEEAAPAHPAEVARLLASSGDFYAAYHLPFFSTYALCEQSALARSVADPARAQSLTAPFATRPGHRLVQLEHARNLAATDRVAAQRFARELASRWTTVDESSAVDRWLDTLAR